MKYCIEEVDKVSMPFFEDGNIFENIHKKINRDLLYAKVANTRHEHYTD